MKRKLSYLLLSAVVLTAAAMWSCKKDPVGGETTENFIDVNFKFSGKDKPSAGDKLYVWLYYSSDKAVAAGTADVTAVHTLTADDITGGVRVTLDEVKSGSKYLLGWVDMDGSGAINKDDLALYYNAVTYDDVKEGAKTPTDIGSAYLLNMNLSVKVGGKPTGDVSDIEGNQYNSVKIGNQTWLKENLRVTKFRDGTAIKTGFSDAEWIKTLIRDTGTDADGTGTPGYCQHPDADIYTDGLLYNWFAASSSKGLCPTGWRTPTEIDWQLLETFLGMTPDEIDRTTPYTGTAAPKLKAVGFGDDSTDDYGFSALPGGQREKDNGTYVLYGTDTYFWASTDARDMGGNGHLQGYRRGFRDTEAGINRYQVHKAAGCPVRCVKDDAVTITLNVNTTFSADADYLPAAGAKMYTYLYFTDPTGKAFAELTADKTETTVLTAADVTDGVKVSFAGLDPAQEAIYVASWIDTDGDDTINDGDFITFYKGLSLEAVGEDGTTPANVAGQMNITYDHKMPLGIVIERGTVKDHENNEYATVKIGTQIWMSENLRVTKFKDGTSIQYIGVGVVDEVDLNAKWTGLMKKYEGEDPDGFLTDPTHGTGDPAYSKNPAYFTETKDTPGVGYIYNWFVVNDAKGICPDGWKVPSDQDWKVLETYIGMSKTDVDKVGNWRGSLAKTLMSTAMGGTDNYGFNMIVTGDRNKDSGAYQNNTTDVTFWTSSPADTDPPTIATTQQSYQRLFRYGDHATPRDGITRRVMSRVYGGSVRCMKDVE